MSSSPRPGLPTGWSNRPLPPLAEFEHPPAWLFAHAAALRLFDHALVTLSDPPVSLAAEIDRSLPELADADLRSPLTRSLYRRFASRCQSITLSQFSEELTDDVLNVINTMPDVFTPPSRRHRYAPPLPRWRATHLVVSFADRHGALGVDPLGVALRLFVGEELDPFSAYELAELLATPPTVPATPRALAHGAAMQ